MPVDADYLYTALLSYNYFPMVKKHRDETPSLFRSEDFGPDDADALIAIFDGFGRNHRRRRDGFDQIEYRTTRFNNVARRMQIPTPMAYARLAKQIRDSWGEDSLNRICTNPSSRIRPELHEDGRILQSDDYEDRLGGRVVVMGGDNPVTEAESLIAASMGCFYFVEADISSCFPSIYTHAISWALDGVNHATKHQRSRDAALWLNQIDECQRMLKRNETLGIPIGPATSNIACEIVLYPVDEAMRDKGYTFTRHIDDYRAYTKTRADAEAFIRDLERELASYLLTINAKKVKIEALPRSLVSPWVLDLKSRLPSEEPVSTSALTDYLNYAVSLNKHEPDGSVVKYATRSMANKLNDDNRALFCQYALNLAVHIPVVLPVLSEVINNTGITFEASALGSPLERHIEYRRSDAVGWTACLYYQTGAEIPNEAAQAIVDSEDCMSMASLIAIGQHEAVVQDFVTSLAPEDMHRLDRYWMLLHELNLRDMLPADGRFDRYLQQSGLSVLKERSVSFISITQWTQYGEGDL